MPLIFNAFTIDLFPGDNMQNHTDRSTQRLATNANSQPTDPLVAKKLKAVAEALGVKDETDLIAVQKAFDELMLGSDVGPTAETEALRARALATCSARERAMLIELQLDPRAYVAQRARRR